MYCNYKFICLEGFMHCNYNFICLGGSGKNDRFYLELNDEHGNKISLPNNEREVRKY